MDNSDRGGLDRVRDILTSAEDVTLPDGMDAAPRAGSDPWQDLEPEARAARPADRPPQRRGDPGEIEVTEDGVARAFSDRHGQDMRFDHDQGAWFRYAGGYWQQDRTAAALHFCRELAREASLGLTGKDLATARRAGFAAGVERLARADRRHAVTQEVWDADPWLLGTPTGTVDLRTGNMTAPRPEDHISKVCAVAPSEFQDCPQWHQFLEDATGGDGDLMSFLAQWAGYCLTGDTSEQSLVLIHGDGGNGKGVFINTLQGLFGDYAKTAGMTTFVKTNSDRHPTDIAKLRGARMVIASETEEGRSWDETRIKTLTGCDKIAARFMRQDEFEYLPQFKLSIVGNHRPSLSSVDRAIRRRFLIVPFNHRPERPDGKLAEKLRAEWPGILRWAINGCLEWQRHGLTRPGVVTDATEDYFASQDVFGQWLAEDCTVDPGKPHLFETSRNLFESWQAFARAAGEDPGTAKRFGDALAKRGLKRQGRRVSGKVSKVWKGIGLAGAIYRPAD